MHRKKPEPKAPKLKAHVSGECLFVESQTKELLYSVCGEGENLDDAIRKLVSEYQGKRMEEARQ